jgi:hypothetical protein
MKGLRKAEACGRQVAAMLIGDPAVSDDCCCKLAAVPLVCSEQVLR